LSQEPGSFGVLTRIFKRSKDDKLSTLLPTLTFGDEVAVKTGSNIFEYRGPEASIRFLTIVASGLGIVPIIELLQRVLSGEEYDVERCELLWINDSKEDFVFNSEIERLENLHPDKFLCARVLDQAITLEDSVLNNKVRDALPLSESGRVAIISSTPTVSTKIQKALDALTYQSENIMIIPV
jgi:ferredoxin-NADP reductase